MKIKVTDIDSKAHGEIDLADEVYKEIFGRPVRQPSALACRPVEKRVVVHDDLSVAREVHVELEAVGPERHAVIEGGERVLGTQSRPAAVSEDEGPAAGRAARPGCHGGILLDDKMPSCPPPRSIAPPHSLNSGRRLRRDACAGARSGTKSATT